MSEEARTEFNQLIVGKNIFTPDVHDHDYTSDGKPFELTSGTFLSNEMWAVSVVAGPKQLDSDRSQLFNEGTAEENRTAALAYVTDLKEGRA